jgi:hypothetical protein
MSLWKVSIALLTQVAMLAMLLLVRWRKDKGEIENNPQVREDFSVSQKTDICRWKVSKNTNSPGHSR